MASLAQVAKMKKADLLSLVDQLSQDNSRLAGELANAQKDKDILTSHLENMVDEVTAALAYQILLGVAFQAGVPSMKIVYNLIGD